MRHQASMPWQGLRGWILRRLFHYVWRVIAWPGLGAILLRQRCRLLRFCFRLYLRQPVIFNRQHQRSARFLA